MTAVRRAVSAAVAALWLTAAAPAQQCCNGNVATYCTAGTSVQGCLPQISSTGAPSADAGSGFHIRVASVPAQRQGLLFYGLQPANQPWAPLSQSVLCVALPRQRMGSLSSGGVAGQCNGSLSLDFNAWRAAHPTALGYPFAQGQTLRAQGWYRDPGAATQTNLSDALAFDLCSGRGDTTPPEITMCAADQAVTSSGNCQALVPDFTSSVVAFDACGGPVVLSQWPPAGTVLFGLDTKAITISAADVVGNTSTCVATLSVTLPVQCQSPPGFVAIQSGVFHMGQTGVATPVHAVTLSYGFWVGASEVTQAQYATLMGLNPSYYQGDANRPVETVTWFDARAYCAALTAQQTSLGNVPPGYEYRLPTEAEWEYFCRAGTTTLWNVGDSIACADANFFGCVGATSPAGSYAANAWGVHDAHGNVWEWCLDSASAYTSAAVTDPFVTGGPARIARGGSAGHDKLFARSALRLQLDPGYAHRWLGFRVALAPTLVP